MRTATTPPPAAQRAVTPPAPRHGAMHDDWHPFTPRRSSRVAARKYKDGWKHPEKKTQDEPAAIGLALPTKRKPTTPARQQKSPPPSALSSPLLPHDTSSRKLSSKHSKRAAPSSSRVRKARPASPGTSDSEPEQSKTHLDPSSHLSAAMSNPFLLPTPAKTPQKKKVSKAAMGSASRVLFNERHVHPDDAMPDPKKTRKSKNFTVYDELVQEEDEKDDGKIQIYEDWQERRPTYDSDEDNPFISRPEDEERLAREQAEYDVRRAATKTDYEKAIEAAAARGEGMIFVFRGKKVLRRFDDCEVPETSEERLSARRIGTGRTHRSSVQPRRLFQEEIAALTATNGEAAARATAAEEANDEADEEAITDIEVPSPTPVKKSNGRKKNTKRGKMTAEVAGQEPNDDMIMTDSQEPETVATTAAADIVEIRSRQPQTPPAQTEGRGRAEAKANNKMLARAQEGRSTSPFGVWTRVKSSDNLAALGTTGSDVHTEAVLGASTGSGVAKRPASPVSRGGKRQRFDPMEM